MIILGLDLSMNSTGYALIKTDNEGNTELIKTGRIKAKAKEKHSQKLRRQHEVIRSLIEDSDITVKESLHYGRPKTSAILAKVHGIVDLLVDDIIEYPPSTIKRVVANNGKAKKKEVEAGVRRLLLNEKCTFKTDDESDAVAVALTYTIIEGM